jgi:signal transduction histidine kinase
MSARILYVDDDPANLIVFEEMFRDDFEIITASGGEEALELLASAPIGLLVCDQRMPGMTGVELAERVRQQWPDVVRYLMTAYADIAAAIDAINRGHVRRYLRKPWDADELRAALREGLEVFDMTHRLREMEERFRTVERVYTLGFAAAGIAHELRNPMSAATGFVSLAVKKLDELARTGPGGALAEEIRDNLTIASESIDRMAEIVDGIAMSSGRASGGPADPARVVELVLRLFGGDLKHRATIEVSVEPGLSIRIGETQLGQVVLNLVVNALQAFPARERHNLVRVSVVRRGEMARLEVADNGPGVPREARARIFEPFFTTREGEGTGLGLALVRRMVEEAAGTISLEEGAGGGACFAVALPLAS